MSKTVTRMDSTPTKGRTSGLEPVALYNVPSWFNPEALVLGFNGFSKLVEITRDPTRPSGRYDNIEDAVKALHKRFQFIPRAKDGEAKCVVHTFLPFIRADFHVALETSAKTLLLGDSEDIWWFETSGAGPLRAWKSKEDMMQGVFPNHAGVQCVYSHPIADPTPIVVHEITAEEDFEKTFTFMMVHHGRAPPEPLLRKVWNAFCARHNVPLDDKSANPFVEKWFGYAKWQVPEKPTLGLVRDPHTTYGNHFSPPRNFEASVRRPYVVMTDPPKFDKGHFTTTKSANGL